MIDAPPIIWRDRPKHSMLGLYEVESGPVSRVPSPGLE